MNLATDILIYAWVGWAVIMLPTLVVLVITACLLCYFCDKILKGLSTIYRLECIRHYFEKMEKEGTHAFKTKPDSEGE